MFFSLLDIQAPIKDYIQQYEQLFSRYLRSDDTLLREVLQYVNAKRGKEIRPLLILLSAHLCNGISVKSMDMAVAVELLHTASLIHDDVVDEADKRRGETTIHERWNNKLAILVGDYLLTVVMQILAKQRSHQLFTAMADLSNNLAMGELKELENQKNGCQTQEDYFNIIENKTAKFLAICAKMGACTTGAPAKKITDLYHFGLNLGMCFQLKDDVLDYSDEDDTGKPTLLDIKTGKITLPLLIALQRATKQERDEIQTMIEAFTSHQSSCLTDDFEQTIRSFILRYEGIHYTYQTITRFKNKALDHLANFQDTPERKNLENLLLYVINRNY